MKAGYLSQYFTAVASKRLSAVEVDPGRSNQHEFNGVSQLKEIFGLQPEKRRFDATFLYFCDHADEPDIDHGQLSWYDARYPGPVQSRDKQRIGGKARTEHRLYFSSNKTTHLMAEGDLLVITKRPDNRILVIITEKDSDMEGQIRWLFSLPEPRMHLSLRAALDNEQDRLGFASRVVLEAIGIEVEVDGSTWLEMMLSRYGVEFPDTMTFSCFAQETLKEITVSDIIQNPDAVLLSWFEREEILFRTFEKHFLGERLQQGFDGENAIESFESLSMQIMNRRKVRAGRALENHLERIFQENDIRYTRGGKTEKYAKPDFIFPGIAEYHSKEFPVTSLSMLGVKTTCKDRWRQITAEAEKIKHKHLLTLEPAISAHQTQEMLYRNVHLVVPAEIHKSYSEVQRHYIICLKDFLMLIKKIQSSRFEGEQ